MDASPALTETQLAALAGRDPAAFERLYRDHHARVYNLAARIVGDPDDAADITQEVFLRAYTRPPAPGRDLRPEPWLYRITVNASYDHLRRRAAKAATPIDCIGEIAAAGDGFAQAELAGAVECCLAGLTPRYRTALVLKDLHGLSNTEIADVMGVHHGAARVLLHRARAAFRRAFRDAAPTGAGGVSALGLAAFLPALPVPAQLHTPPSFATAAPPFGPATPLPPAAEPLAGAAPAAPPGAPAATVPGGVGPAATFPLAGAPAAAAPAAVAPTASTGILAALGGAAGVKAAIAAVAVVAATGGGLAARHAASDGGPQAARTLSRTGAPAYAADQPSTAPESHRQVIAERLRLVGGGSPVGLPTSDGAGGTQAGGGGAGGAAAGSGSGGGSAGGETGDGSANGGTQTDSGSGTRGGSGGGMQSATGGTTSGGSGGDAGTTTGNGGTGTGAGTGTGDGAGGTGTDPGSGTGGTTTGPWSGTGG